MNREGKPLFVGGGRAAAFAIALILLLLALSACGGGGGSSSGSGTGPGLVSITVSPATAPLFLGQTQQFTAQVVGTSDTSVTWSVDGVAGGSSGNGTISAAGLYTAPQVLPSSTTVTVTAMSNASPSASGSATVTIGPMWTSVYRPPVPASVPARRNHSPPAFPAPAIRRRPLPGP